MLLRIALPIAIGAGLGALMGYFGQCSTGACPLTSTWWRGALYGAVLGAFLVALLARDNDLGEWKMAPVKWHLLALSQGLVWATAMVCIMFGWMGTGIAIGTPIQVGTQTIVSSLWGIVMFGEFRALKDRGKAYSRFIGGAALTILGIAVMALL